ncbi:outer membrane beta-barrel protein [Neolewinella persica]|uniref:outer membrane beta-barrel protein n=1 Tax=Neolewinella persica TaxID=70998 RepID=UPI000361B88E|nr:outer membrane beta-barrel protein [Neolewinella persica]
MKHNLRNYLGAFFVLITIFTPLAAQVSGISYTFAPNANYTFWDGQAGLKDGFLVGGRLGIGFGEMVEFRGSYMFDLGLKRDFSGVIEGREDIQSELTDREVNLSRYGGEIKLNLGRSRLLPFLTLGAGIQSIELDGGFKNEHIYASGGLGVTVSIADRFTFKLEGKNTAYNFNPVRNLLTDQERTVNFLSEADFFNERMSNWSIGTGLTVYLGGRRPGTLSEVDQAYAQIFNDGFRSLSLIVEPTLSYISFDDALPYRDTYLGGASLGLDFGPYVGVRAFYMRNMDDNKINLNFDRMSIYGADFRFRLTTATTGISPFITLGGGYINLDDDYIGRDDANTVLVSQAFASGGLGASLNLSRSFQIVGSYKALLTTGNNVEDLESADQIRTSNQWTAGINLVFGKKAQRPDAMFTSTAEAQIQRAQAEAILEKQTALADQAKRNADATRQLKNDYEASINSLNEALATARTQRDSVAIDSLVAAIEKNEKVVIELEGRAQNLQKEVVEAEKASVALETEMVEASQLITSSSPAPAAAPQNAGYFQGQNVDGTSAQPVSRLSFTPAEFEGLIEEIFEGLNYGMPATGMPVAGNFETDYGMMAAQDTARIFALEQQVRDLSAALKELNQEQNDAIEELRAGQDDDRKARMADKEALRTEINKSTQSILEEIRAMRTALDNKSNMTDKEREQIKKDADKAARLEEKRLKEAAKQKKKDGGQ